MVKTCCTDRNGRPKPVYRSKSDAEAVARVRRAQGESVLMYPCEHGPGWHLTASDIHAVKKRSKRSDCDQRDARSLPDRKQAENRLYQALVKRLKQDGEQDTLETLDRKITRLLHDVEEKTHLVQSRKTEFRASRNNLKLAEQDLNTSLQCLCFAEREYERTRKRLAAKPA